MGFELLPTGICCRGEDGVDARPREFLLATVYGTFMTLRNLRKQERSKSVKSRLLRDR